MSSRAPTIPWAISGLTYPLPNQATADWEANAVDAIQDGYLRVGLRLDDVVRSGTLANIPIAVGSNRFYLATDASVLYFDAVVGGVARWVQVNPSDWRNGINFGADPTGVADSAAAINAAFADLPANGGTVYLPAGLYSISTDILIGDGSSGAISTKANIRLIGDGGPTNIAFGPSKGGTTIQAMAGWAGTQLIHVLGPISGVHLEGLLLDGNSLAATCLRCDHMERSYIADIEAQNFTGTGIIHTAYSAATGFSNGANQNQWRNVQALSLSGVVTCMRIGEPSETGFDIAQNLFLGLNFRAFGRGSTGLKLQYCDASQFLAMTITATIPVDVVPSASKYYPAGIQFDGFVGNGALTDTITAATNATPIVLTTSIAHGRRVGDWVGVRGVVGNLGANGVWRLSAASGTSMTLEGSAGTGAWTSGGNVQGSGVQETSGTWTAGVGNTSGMECLFNNEGWENFFCVPPPAIGGIRGRMTNGSEFGYAMRDMVFAASSASNALTATVVTAFGGAGYSYTIKPYEANRVGTVVHIEASGVYTTDATPGRTLAVAIRIGGSNMLQATLALETSATDRRWMMRSEFTVRTIGASATIAITETATSSAGAGGTLYGLGATAARTYTKDLTAPLVLDCTGSFSAAGQSATLDGFKVWIERARETA